MFRRRVELHPLRKLKELFWPSSGWKRSFQYGWRRVWRLSGTPHAIALGVAAGVFASCTPLFGFHILLAMLVAWVIRGNLVASALGTFLGNPLTFPFIFLLVYEVGTFMIGVPAGHVDPDIEGMVQQAGAFDRLLPHIVPLLVGSVPVGIVSGCVIYAITRSGVEAYQSRRRKMLEQRAKERREAAEAHPAAAAGLGMTKGDAI